MHDYHETIALAEQHRQALLADASGPRRRHETRWVRRRRVRRPH